MKVLHLLLFLLVISASHAQAGEEEEVFFGDEPGSVGDEIPAPKKQETTMKADQTLKSTELPLKPTPSELARKARARAAEAAPRKGIGDYLWELLALLFLVAYGVNYFRGKAANLAIAKVIRFSLCMKCYGTCTNLRIPLTAGLGCNFL